MYRVLDVIRINGRYCVAVEGDTFSLKNGIKLCDEKGNYFIVETVGMVKFKNIEDFKTFAHLVLLGDVENIGKNLSVTD